MHGHTPTLIDIVLEELPDPVDLQCQEQLENEEEEGLLLDDYVVYACCGHCERHLKVYIRGTVESVRRLQELLLSSLEFVCPACGRPRR
ncbi:E7 protein [Bos taurus papillomavirus 16]|uniref:Protein E7 n=1 Tax=Bos taurus papillomavirus 16 TaxID=1887214 RepID=A0A1B2K1Z7_9PAPI|nr:E7 protein [Bos taurus papillomavirus 16]ANZ90236.1 E7 protein [Bos taurus papillomavirus 16]